MQRRKAFPANFNVDSIHSIQERAAHLPGANLNQINKRNMNFEFLFLRGYFLSKTVFGVFYWFKSAHQIYKYIIKKYV